MLISTMIYYRPEAQREISATLEESGGLSAALLRCLLLQFSPGEHPRQLHGGA
jgi:hypothetical protein